MESGERNLEGDLNPGCTHTRENVGQSNSMPETMCASPEGGSSNGEAQAIVTRLEPLVLPGGREGQQVPLE